MISKKPPVPSKKSKRFANAIGAGVIGLAAVCLVATAILIARPPSQPADKTAAETPSQEAKVPEPSPITATRSGAPLRSRIAVIA